MKPTLSLKTFVNRCLSCLMLAFVAAGVTGCGHDGVDGPVEMDFTEIVTFEGNRDGRAVFTFSKVDDSPLITLTSSSPLVTDDEPGTRMLVNYTMPGNQPYTSGEITLRGWARITQSPVMTDNPDALKFWDLDPLWLYSVWRSGYYINLRVRLTYTAEPRVFGLVLDPSTADSEYPTLYLAHIISTDVDYHDRDYYASFDISSVCSRSGVKGVRIYVNDTNIGRQIFTFLF